MSRKKVPDKDKKALRQKLNEIGCGDVTLHRQRIEALNVTLRHSIKHIQTSDDRFLDCMMYAFGIPSPLVKAVNDPAYGIPEAFGNSFPRFLKETSELETSDEQVILYFSDGEMKHGGLIKGDRVISKWGKDPVYEHAIAEVPASYGDEYEIFKRPSDTTNKFIEFVRNHPRYVDIRTYFEDRVAEWQHSRSN